MVLKLQAEDRARLKVAREREDLGPQRGRAQARDAAVEQRDSVDREGEPTLGLTPSPQVEVSRLRAQPRAAR